MFNSYLLKKQTTSSLKSVLFYKIKSRSMSWRFYNFSLGKPSIKKNKKIYTGFKKLNYSCVYVSRGGGKFLKPSIRVNITSLSWLLYRFVYIFW